MRDDLERLDTVTAEISTKGRFAETTQWQMDGVWPRFAAFCASYGREPLPCSEDTVLAFLAATPEWTRHTYARDLVTRIRQKHRDEGADCPPWGRVEKQLNYLRRTAPARQPKVSALHQDEAEQMAQRLKEPAIAAASVAYIRGRLCLVRLLKATKWSQARLDKLALVPNLGFTYDGTAIEVHPASPEAELLEDAVRAIRSGDSTGKAGIGERVHAAARRAGLAVAGPAEVQNLDSGEFHSLIAHCDPDVDRHTRDLAWLTLGIGGGLRHISLADFDIRDVYPTPTGYRVVFRKAKLSAGKTLTKEFHHLGADPDTCIDILCPVCALARQLDACRRQGRTTGPVLATYYGGRWRAMTRQNGRLRILRAWGSISRAYAGEATGRAAGQAACQAADGTAAETTDETAGERGEKRRIATRSLRRTAATWAIAAGMSMSEAAEHVTNHQTLTVFASYVELTRNDEVHPRFE
ncbi:hypothetical protein [Nocardioides sp. URHA0032]|uniref:hypothetical protein n=1 Tax=Nocardioides sp. URHA0032 TaxID=1380388 RepID=UPI0012DD34BC|nr:hypothetical protein [Nocardioides sp. URHA0032]